MVTTFYSNPLFFIDSKNNCITPVLGNGTIPLEYSYKHFKLLYDMTATEAQEFSEVQTLSLAKYLLKFNLHIALLTCLLKMQNSRSW